jgi:hypothetical protein
MDEVKTDEEVLKEYDVISSEPAGEPNEEEKVDQAAALEAKFEEIKAQYEGREAQYKEKLAAQDSKLSQLERLVQDSYSRAHPAPAEKEEPEVKFEQADLVKDPIGTLERVSTARTKKAIAEYDASMRPVLEQLVERGYQGELAAVSQRKYYPYVKDKIEQAFTANPALKTQAGSVEYAYRMFVGEHIEDIEKEWAKDKGTEPVGGEPTPKPTPPGKTGRPGPPEDKPTKKVELSPDQQRVKAKFAALGLELTDKDLGVAEEVE